MLKVVNRVHLNLSTYGKFIWVRSRSIICSFMACSRIGVSYEIDDLWNVLIANSREVIACLNNATLQDEQEGTTDGAPREWIGWKEGTEVDCRQMSTSECFLYLQENEGQTGSESANSWVRSSVIASRILCFSERTTSSFIASISYYLAKESEEFRTYVYLLVFPFWYGVLYVWEMLQLFEHMKVARLWPLTWTS